MAHDAPPASSLALGSLLEGRFELGEDLGRGASGRVFAARDRHTGAQVAVKVVRAGSGGEAGGVAARLGEEAAMLARLRHPNIVSLLAAGRFEDAQGAGAYLVMERLSGHTLGQWLRRTPRLRVAQLAPLLAALAAALDAAHQAGVAHGDVRPANVFLEGLEGRVKLIDFGAARWLGDAEGEASAESDLRALAALCLEALGGSGPPEARAVLERGLASPAAAGFVSAGALADAFIAAAGLELPGAPPASRLSGPSAAGAERFSEGRGSGLPAEPPSWMPREPLRISSPPPPPPPKATGVSPRVLVWLVLALLLGGGALVWWLA